MTTDQINYFLKVVEHKSFSHAADELFVSQSSLSKHIKALENEVGVELFSRQGNGVILTPAGTCFQEYAVTAQHRLRDLMAAMSHYQDQWTGHILLGTLPLLHDYRLSNQLAHFQVQHPSVQIDLLERDQTELIRLLDSEALDMAFVRIDEFTEEKYEFAQQIRDRMVLVCSRNAPLAARSTVSWDDLSHEKFVLLNKRSQIYSLLHKHLVEHHLDGNIVYTSSRHLSLLAMVQEGLGVSILPSRLAAPAGFEDLVCIPLEEPLWSVVSFVKLRGRKCNAATELLFHYFQHISEN